MNIDTTKLLSSLGLTTTSSKKTDAASRADALWGTEEKAEDSFGSTTVLASQISKTAQSLSKRQKSLTAFASSLLDAAHFTEATQDGFKKAETILTNLKSLLTQAQAPDLSEQNKQGLNQKIQEALKSYDQLVNTTKYSGNTLLSDAHDIFIQTSETSASRGMRFHLVDVSSKTMNLQAMDITSSASIQKSLDVVGKAMDRVQSFSKKINQVSGQISKTTDRLQKSFESILKASNLLNTNMASLMAQNLSSNDLLSSQKTGGLSNIAGMFLE